MKQMFFSFLKPAIQIRKGSGLMENEVHHKSSNETESTLDIEFTSYVGDAKGSLPKDYKTKDFSKVKKSIKGLKIKNSNKVKACPS